MKYKKLFLFTMFIFFFAVYNLNASQISAYSQVSSKEVYTGEAFTFQIVIDGTNNVEKPDLSSFTNFNVKYAGDKAQNSQSIMIINGKTTRQITYKYIYQYTLTPRKKGLLIIPAVMVQADGKNYMTKEIIIQVKEPTEVNEYKIRQYLSGTSGYVGEPIVYTLTWYVQGEIERPLFTVPLLDDRRFRVEDYQAPKSQNKTYEIQIGNDKVILIQSEQKFKGQLFTTLTFKKTLIPYSSGDIVIPKATLEFNGILGYKEAYDFFHRKVKQPIVKKFVIASNTLNYHVKDIPLGEKPKNYSGLIGKYDISINASPKDVSVGDPITLNIILKGKGNLKDARLPDLYKLKYLTKDFKIPEEISAGEIKKNTKIFTQTIRAIHHQVKEIPPIVISYFNTTHGKYEYTRSNSIAINVKPSSEFSLSDVEGMEEMIDKKEIEEIAEGILYNYEGLNVIKNQSIDMINIIKNPYIIFLILLPMFLYLLLFYFYKLRPALNNNENNKDAVKKSYNKLIRIFNTMLKGKHKLKNSSNLIFMELKNYLGLKLKLKLKPASITFADIQSELVVHHVSCETIDKLRIIFSRFDAFNYGAAAINQDEFNQLYTETCERVKEIERSFK